MRRTCRAGTSPRQGRTTPAVACQPPLAPAGADAAPGMLAASTPLPAVPLLGMPDGAVDGAGAMPPVALELAPVPVSVSLFF
ncbi:Secreted protein [Burkholderia ambifaria]